MRIEAKGPRERAVQSGATERCKRSCLGERVAVGSGREERVVQPPRQYPPMMFRLGGIGVGVVWGLGAGATDRDSVGAAWSGGRVVRRGGLELNRWLKKPLGGGWIPAS